MKILLTPINDFMCANFYFFYFKVQSSMRSCSQGDK
jgi:hypothetical protein